MKPKITKPPVAPQKPVETSKPKNIRVPEVTIPKNPPTNKPTTQTTLKENNPEPSEDNSAEKEAPEEPAISPTVGSDVPKETSRQLLEINIDYYGAEANIGAPKDLVVELKGAPTNKTIVQF